MTRETGATAETNGHVGSRSRELEICYNPQKDRLQFEHDSLFAAHYTSYISEERLKPERNYHSRDKGSLEDAGSLLGTRSSDWECVDVRQPLF